MKGSNDCVVLCVRYTRVKINKWKNRAPQRDYIRDKIADREASLARGDKCTPLISGS